MDYITVLLNSSHNRKDFKCGKELLDNYIHYQAQQDIKRNLSACFIIADENNSVTGFYTLSNAGIPRELLPDNIKKKLPPSYNNLPATLLGRLAVDKSIAGKGYGELLLMDALKRSYFTSIGSIASIAVIVDPIDQNAIRFYEKYDFSLLPDSGKMFLPMKTLSGLFDEE
jgi:GNAT superfamily N-acetyltransferase